MRPQLAGSHGNKKMKEFVVIFCTLVCGAVMLSAHAADNLRAVQLKSLGTHEK
ncbi:hypothetical protein ACFS07_35485 [Undibacterium arcticum]